MSKIIFRPIGLSDGPAVQQKVYTTECRNCDLNFMNLMSWRFLFHTEIAFYGEWLLFRFQYGGHLAYLPPIGEGDWNAILPDMIADANEQGEPFCLMGVCERSLQRLFEIMPGRFMSEFDRSFTDYVYLRESLAQLAGKKLQSKRNHIHRFVKENPDYEFQPLTSDTFQECLDLVRKWHERKGPVDGARLTLEEEYSAMNFTFNHWGELAGLGGVLRVKGRLIAFTYGAPINYDTFDVCVEKADVDYEGAFTMINREFARSLPASYRYVNREEDLGIEGLRKAKMSYQPTLLLHKHIVRLVP